MSHKNRYIVISIGLCLLLFFGYLIFKKIGDKDKKSLFDLQKGNVLAQIKTRGKLIVITRNAPTTYYEGPEGPMGFEYDLISNFAAHLNVQLELITRHSITDILNAMKNDQADLAAAAITRTFEREKSFLFGPDYYKVQQMVVTHRDDKKLTEINDLIGKKGLIIANSSYNERLMELKTNIPELSWDTTEEMSTEQLCEMVAKKEIDYTIADSNILAVNRRYLPNLTGSFPISEEQGLAWVLRKNAIDLKAELETWLEAFDASGQLAQLREKYYAHIEKFDFVDTIAFHRRIENRLPIYQKLFEKSAKAFKLPWTLIAAQAYQESHWNPKAKSPTGVRGIMMLTKNTAKSLGVTNRIDPAQSIEGGTKYLAKLIKRVPKNVDDENRLWFALAAYNVGMGHIHDAQKLARKLKKDHTEWQDIKTVLPLLSQKKYYQHLKYGYARGSEPVIYVEQITNYRDILENSLNKSRLPAQG